MYNRDNLKNQAELYKNKFHDGEINIELAKEMIMPYINLINIEREKLTKAYGQYLPAITFEKFMKKKT